MITAAFRRRRYHLRLRARPPAAPPAHFACGLSALRGGCGDAAELKGLQATRQREVGEVLYPFC